MMYDGRMMGDSPLTTNTTSLDAVLGGSDPQVLWDLQDTMVYGGNPQHPATETQFLNDYQPLDLEEAMFLNGTNGTNFTSIIPEGLKYINRTQLIAYSLLFPFAAIGNLVVFVALFRNRHRKSRVNMMIMHLSLADMIVTFVFLPTEITWHITIEWVFGNVGCKVYKFLSAFGFYMSSMVLVCISLDRYFAVLHPLKVNDAQRRGKIMLFFAWLISSVISLPQTVIFNVQLHPEIPDFYQCVTFGFFDSNNGGEMMYTVFCISFLYFIPLTIIIIAYTRIILEITKKSRDNKKDYSRGERYHGRLHLRRSNMSNIERARTRTLRMTFIIVMAFIWCWTPYALGTLWNFIDPKTFYNMNQQVQDILFIIAVSNSVVNPIIYGRYSISCCRGIWNKAGEFCCYCCCFCCPCSAQKRLPTTHPPNINSCKSNGHFNAASANTRSTIYNNSARDKMVVGVRLQDQTMGRYRKLQIEDDLTTQSIILDDITNTESLSSKDVKIEVKEPSSSKSIADNAAGGVVPSTELEASKESDLGCGKEGLELKGESGDKTDHGKGKNHKSVEGIRLVVISCEELPSSSPKKGRKKSDVGIVVLEPIKDSPAEELERPDGEIEDKESQREGEERKKERDTSFNLPLSLEGYSPEASEAVRRSPATKGRHIREVLEVQVTKDGDFVCRKLPEHQRKK